MCVCVCVCVCVFALMLGSVDIHLFYMLLQCYLDLEMLNMSKYKSHLFMDTEDPGSGQKEVENSEPKEVNHESDQQQNYEGKVRDCDE